MKTVVRFIGRSSDAHHAGMIEHQADVRGIDQEGVMLEAPSCYSCHYNRGQYRAMISKGHLGAAAWQFLEKLQGCVRERHGDRPGTCANAENLRNFAQRSAFEAGDRPSSGLSSHPSRCDDLC